MGHFDMPDTRDTLFFTKPFLALDGANAADASPFWRTPQGWQSIVVKPLGCESIHIVDMDRLGRLQVFSRRRSWS